VVTAVEDLAATMIAEEEEVRCVRIAEAEETALMVVIVHPTISAILPIQEAEEVVAPVQVADEMDLDRI
jgi:hypothetical protein